MKFLSLILWLGELCTDANNANAVDTDNYARRSNHDYTCSFGRIPNKPKSSVYHNSNIQLSKTGHLFMETYFQDQYVFIEYFFVT